jgi:hypothetical protein
MADTVVLHERPGYADDSSSGSFAVILVALLVIVGLAIFALRFMPVTGTANVAAPADRIQIDMPAPQDTAPATPSTAQ